MSEVKKNSSMCVCTDNSCEICPKHRRDFIEADNETAVARRLVRSLLGTVPGHKPTAMDEDLKINKILAAFEPRRTV